MRKYLSGRFTVPIIVGAVIIIIVSVSVAIVFFSKQTEDQPIDAYQEALLGFARGGTIVQRIPLELYPEKDAVIIVNEQFEHSHKRLIAFIDKNDNITHVVSDTDYEYVVSTSLSPDKTKLVYTTFDRKPTSEDLYKQDTTIWVVDLETQEKTYVDKIGHYQIIARISPDNEHLAAVSPQNIEIHETSELGRAIADDIFDRFTYENGTDYIPEPVWLDNDKVSYVVKSPGQEASAQVLEETRMLSVTEDRLDNSSWQ